MPQNICMLKLYEKWHCRLYIRKVYIYKKSLLKFQLKHSEKIWNHACSFSITILYRNLVCYIFKRLLERMEASMEDVHTDSIASRGWGWGSATYCFYYQTWGKWKMQETTYFLVCVAMYSHCFGSLPNNLFSFLKLSFTADSETLHICNWAFDFCHLPDLVNSSFICWLPPVKE